MASCYAFKQLIFIHLFHVYFTCWFLLTDTKPDSVNQVQCLQEVCEKKCAEIFKNRTEMSSPVQYFEILNHTTVHKQLSYFRIYIYINRNNL